MSESAVDSPPTPARAGRRLPAAIVVGLGLLAVVGASLAFRKEIFIVLAVLACGAGLWELAHALTRRGIQIPLLPLLVGMVGILVSSYVSGAEALLVAFMLTVGGVLVWRVLDGGGSRARGCRDSWCKRNLRSALSILQSG